MDWEKNSFESFSLGTMGNGGQNIYVSANGILQRIHLFDTNGNGYPDLLFANSQSMDECPPLYLYNDPLSSEDYIELESGGSYEGTMADINGDGYDDLIVACQNNGTHSDITSIIFYGSPDGLSERYKVELPVPNATGVAAGDFRGRNDGKKDLAFLREDGLRLFYQDEGGIIPYKYVDIELDCVAIDAQDIDADGCCDLYLKKNDGSTVIMWGGSTGLSIDDISVLHVENNESAEVSTSTPGRKPAYRGWRNSVLHIDGNLYLFRTDGDCCFFYTCDRKRNFNLAFSIPCENAVYAAAGDLNGDGHDDIAIACCSDISVTENSYVFWNSGGIFDYHNATAIPSRSAQSCEICDLSGDGRKQLVLCQGGTDELHSTRSYIYSFMSTTADPIRLAELQSGDAMKIVTGKTKGGAARQLVVINHERGRVRGDENIYIYLGGSDGYSADSRIALPGWSAVEGKMYDHNDNGYTDVLVVNCAENAPHLDPGCFLYIGGENGFDADRRVTIPTVRAHGAAIGDFGKRGYLDIAVGGANNREIRIFRGGPTGYDVCNPDKIVLGPKCQGYNPPAGLDPLTSGDPELHIEYGSVRWLFTADFNGNGWLDLFVSQISGHNCFILWGGPDGFLTDNMLVLRSGGVGSANAADLNGNGYLDLVLCGYQSMGKRKAGVYEAYVTIYWGGPDGFEEHRKTMLPAYCVDSVTIGDFNGDGILDIFATAYNSGRSRDILASVYYGEEGGIYRQKNRQFLFNHSGAGCMAGDFNGDGYIDLAIACHKGEGNHVSESFVFRGGPDGLSEARKTVLPTVGPHGMSTVHPGNIMTRSNEEYYYSEIYALEGLRLLTAEWDAVVPDTCWIEISFRHGASKEECEAGCWSRQFVSGADLDELDFNGGYIQYRLTLGSRMSCGTPRISNVRVRLK